MILLFYVSADTPARVEQRKRHGFLDDLKLPKRTLWNCLCGTRKDCACAVSGDATDAARDCEVCHPHGIELGIGATELLLEELNYWKVSISDLDSLDISVWEERLRS